MQVLTEGRARSHRRADLRAAFEIALGVLAAFVAAAAIMGGTLVVVYLVWLR